MRKLLALAIFVFAVTAFDCGKGGNPRPKEQGQAYYVPTGSTFTDSMADIHQTLSAAIGVPEERSAFTSNGTTPKGARYYSVLPVPPEFLNAIDEGLQSQINRYNAVFPNWANYDQVADYDILIITGDAQNVETAPGSPAMYVQGIQTAGTNIGNSGVPRVKKPYIVLPQQEFVLITVPATSTEPAKFVRKDMPHPWGYLEYWTASVQWESEHVRESVNDRGYFEKFAISGDSHPHDIP